MADAKLIIKTSGQSDREILLSGGTSIGRASDNSISIEADRVSRYHAIIDRRGEGFWLSDLGSRNGTTVNGISLAAERKLEDGDSIVLGEMATLEFHSNGVQTFPRVPGAELANKSEAAEAPQHSVPLGSKAQLTSTGGSRAVLTGLAIVAVVVGVFLIAQVTSRSRPVDSNANTEVKQPPNASTNSQAVAGPPQNHDSLPEGGQHADGEGTPQMEPTLMDVRHMSELLGTQISGKSRSTFAVEMVNLIKQRTRDYRNYNWSDAERNRQHINAAFGAEGLPRVLGFVLAMSRSNFRDQVTGEQGIGLWRVPRSIAQGYLLRGESESSYSDPKRCAEITAAYLKKLVNDFSDLDDFMYVVACFGMTSAEAYDIRRKLDAEAPVNSPDRYDFWKMVEKRVIPRERANSVVDFIAAGIVGTYPDRFHANARSLDELYH